MISNMVINRWKNKFLKILVFICVPIFICGCKDDREDYNYSKTGKETTVSFSVRVPGAETPKTYALDQFDENEVRTIEILLFNSISGEYIKNPIYSNTISDNPENIRIKTFTVKVLEGTYDMIVLANSRQSLTSILNEINAGDLKASVLEKLLVHNTGKWNTDSGSNEYIAIPMWGEISGITVTSGMSSNIPLTLLRMVSKIDVTLATDDAKNKFELKSVRLYNYNNKGYIAPLDSNWDGDDYTVVAPSIPASATKPENPGQSPLLYDGSTINSGVSCTSEIYTFEAPAGSSSNLHSNTCLVIGGIYENDSNETYYRIDFTNSSETTVTYLPLLRNHCYKVNITALAGAGYTSPEEAFKYPTFNIESEIISWNESKITDIVYDGQYMLGVSQREYIFSREERAIYSDDNALLITTDYPEGWKIEKIIDEEGKTISDWLDLSIRNGDAGTTTDVSIILKENEQSDPRKGFIHLVAGRLRTAVEITQDIETGKNLIIKDILGLSVNEPFFSSPVGVQPEAQQFTLKWLPTTSDVSVSIENVGDEGFDFDDYSDKPGISFTTISDPTGEGRYTLNIKPRAFTNEEVAAKPFLDKISKINFTLYNGKGYASRNIFLHHIHYNVVVETKDYYMLNGSRYSLRVKSNTGWRIKSVTEELDSGAIGALLNLGYSDNLRAGELGGNNTELGDLLSFTAANTNTSGGKVKIVFESLEANFDDISIELNLASGYYPAMHLGWAGSNIYYDQEKGHLTFKDVNTTTHQNYQGLYFKWGSLYGISPVGYLYSMQVPLYGPGGETFRASWFDIEHIGDNERIQSFPPSGKTDRDRAYLYEVTDEVTGRGDICKYLTDKGWAPPGRKWRMPTSTEFEPLASYSNTGSIYDLRPDKEDGSFIITHGWNKSDTGSPFFPASANRNHNYLYTESLIVEVEPGQLVNGGKETMGGAYWASSTEKIYSFGLWFNLAGALPDTKMNSRENAFTIRCVVDSWD